MTRITYPWRCKNSGISPRQFVRNYAETVPFHKFPHEVVRWNYATFCSARLPPFKQGDILPAGKFIKNIILSELREDSTSIHNFFSTAREVLRNYDPNLRNENLWRWAFFRKSLTFRSFARTRPCFTCYFFHQKLLWIHWNISKTKLNYSLWISLQQRENPDRFSIISWL